MVRVIEAIPIGSDASLADIIATVRTVAREKVDICGTFSEIMQSPDRGVDEPPPSVTRMTTLADFVFIKKISSGAYAQVFLVRKIHTGDIFAMKVIPISKLKKSSELKRVLAEKDILLQFDNPFIVNFCIFSF
jgi:serine/threonine protein kinase